jgi:hypothetical protein
MGRLRGVVESPVVVPLGVGILDGNQPAMDPYFEMRSLAELEQHIDAAMHLVRSMGDESV